MKTPLSYLCFLAAFLFNSKVSAQTIADQRFAVSSANYNESPNIIKTNVTAYLFRNINLSYERIFTEKFSAQISYSTILNGSIPFSWSTLQVHNVEELSTAEMNYSSFTVEPRFYLNKKGYAQGFYLAPYYRHSHLEVSNLIFQYDADGVQNTANLSGKVNGNSGGLALGIQWNLGQNQNWILDFNMIGAHYGAASGDLVAVSSRPLTAREQQVLQDELNTLDVPFVKIKAQANSNGATAQITGPWAGVRFGLSAGYRF